MHNIVLEEI